MSKYIYRLNDPDYGECIIVHDGGMQRMIYQGKFDKSLLPQGRFKTEYYMDYKTGEDIEFIEARMDKHECNRLLGRHFG